MVRQECDQVASYLSLQDLTHEPRESSKNFQSLSPLLLDCVYARLYARQHLELELVKVLRTSSYSSADDLPGIRGWLLPDEV